MAAKKISRKLIITVLIALLALGLIGGLLIMRRRRNPLGSSIVGDFGERVNFTLSAGGKKSTVKGYHVLSEYNTYLSIRDVAGALSGTEKHFNVQRGKDVQWEINTSRNYVPTTKKENTPFAVEFPGEYSGTNDAQGRDGLVMYAPSVSVDGDRQAYRFYYKADTDGSPLTSDAFVSLMDLGFMLDLSLEYTGEKELRADLDRGFSVDLERLEAAEYFHDLDGAVLANAATGEVLYAWDAVHQTEIASTSKLMTWLLVQEAMNDGRLTLDSTVKISENVMRLTASAYGLDICRQNWSVGKEVTVRDLIAAMLLPSSNEAALALAEAVMTSYGHTEDLEKHFVRKMNDRAYELKLTSAMFYNACGLPQYEADQIMAKRGSKMSANDLYILSAYIMNWYHDEFTAFSSKQSIPLPSFGENVRAVSSYHEALANFPVTGMKSGTTDRAGCCLVASMDVRVNGEIQTVIAVVLGAENQKLRYEQTMTLLAYARQHYR